ncbi:MAG: hypothetical protein A2Y54_07905 [Chloroflexi bacterium RBG_16_51_16]|nr:MAG: hypothetical protein A2Y54_07905 [Chloroflexi bacterium RBG_16_51_16]
MFPITGDTGIKYSTCPTNGKPGYPVKVRTLKGLLTRSLIELRETTYRFCPDPDCPTVYFSEDGSQLFDESALKEKVYQKHPHDNDGFICYCFRYTLGKIHSEMSESGSTSIPVVITTGVREGKCACDIRNPQGHCCLGNVKSLIKEIHSLDPFK